jgi:hypothetical protein
MAWTVRSSSPASTSLAAASAPGPGGYCGCGTAITCNPAAAAERSPFAESSTAAHRQQAALLPAANGPALARAACLRPGHPQARLAAMPSSTDRNPEDEYADHDTEQPSAPEVIPDDEPEEDVLEQRQEVPYGEDDR